MPACAQQQLTGIVVDEDTDEGIPMATVTYKGHHVAVAADMEGNFSIERHRPYAELVAGVHNIFKILQLEYVRRLSYLDLPASKK